MPRYFLRILLAGLLALAGCQQPQPQAQPAAAVIEGKAYLFFNAPIVPASRDLFIADIDKFQQAGAREIELALNSPGGDIDAAQGMVDYMTRVHAQNGVSFVTYNVGMVASAATYVFLQGQSRYSVERGVFLFHAAGARSNGPVSAEALRDQAAKLEAYERMVRATLRERSKLTDEETQTYVRRTVVLSADDARRDGIIEAIAAYPASKSSPVMTIAMKPHPGAAPVLPGGKPAQIGP